MVRRVSVALIPWAGIHAGAVRDHLEQAPIPPAPIPPRPEEFDEELRETGDIELLVNVVAEVMESGTLISGDPVSVALGLWAGVHGMVMLLLTIPHFQHPTLRIPEREILFDTVIDMWMRGVVAG